MREGGSEAVPGEVDEVRDDLLTRCWRGRVDPGVGDGAHHAHQGVAPGGGALGRCACGGEGLAHLLRHQLHQAADGVGAVGRLAAGEQGRSTTNR